MKEIRCYSCHINHIRLHKNLNKCKEDYLKNVYGAGVILCTACGCRVKYEQTGEGRHSVIYVSN